ncbi:helix-turn-helix domain-containing protein [Vibrio sp. PP-XX7]
MVIKALRLQRGWSQEQLAELTGLSVRTIQRVEKGQSPSLESLRAFAAVFDMSVEDIQVKIGIRNTPDQKMLENEEQDAQIDQVTGKVRRKRLFLKRGVNYLFTVAILFFINLLINLFTGADNLWAIWSAFGLGVAFVIRTIQDSTYFLFNSRWEQKEIKKQLSRK